MTNAGETHLDPTLLIALVVLHLIALVDVATSRLGRTAKVLWCLTVVFLVGVGLLAWLLTRHTAHQPLPHIDPAPDDGTDVIEEPAQP